jgi:hypothetical protein
MLIDNTETLKVLGGVTGQPKLCAGLAARRLLRGHEVDVQVYRVVGDYMVNITEVFKEGILLEVSLSVNWDGLDEYLRLSLLDMFCSQLIFGAERSIRRGDAAVRAARARFGMPPGG